MLQDDEGYKSKAWHHFDYFWKNPQTKGLRWQSEIVGQNNLEEEDQERIKTEFAKLHPGQPTEKPPPKLTKKSAKSQREEEEAAAKEEKARKKRKTLKTILEKLVRVVDDLTHDGEKVSLPKIKQMMKENYNVDAANTAGKNLIAKAFKAAIETKQINQLGGSYTVRGASFSIRLIKPPDNRDWWEGKTIGTHIERSWGGAWRGSSSKVDTVGSHEIAKKLVKQYALVKQK